MREYKSKLTQAIKFQTKLMKEKESEIAELLVKRTSLQANLEKKESKYEHFKNEMQGGRVVDSSYFFGVFNENMEQNLKEEIKRLDKEIRFKQMEREKIKKKKEVICDIDEKRKLAFYKELQKKERKQIENTIAAMRQLKEGEEDGSFYE